MEAVKKTSVSKCPKCKAEFTCSPSGDCWCSHYHIPPENLEYLKKAYSGCLCPKCLKEFEKQPYTR